MCPVCIATATATWIAAGATSTGGISALLVSKLRTKPKQPNTNTADLKLGEQHGR